MQALPPMPLPTTNRSILAGILPSGIALGGLTALLGGLASILLGLGSDFVLRAVLLFGLSVVSVSVLALWSPDLRSFGPANRVTLLRVALLVLVAAALGERPGQGLAWAIIGVTTAALLLDGVDGRIARRTGTSSAFGARFDMETDAALIMVLAVLCWQFDKAGGWILAAGAMRYLFVMAAKLLPWMRKPLPYSRRRQTVCILQASFMLGVISPIIPQPASAALAAGTLAMLGASFGKDIHWLWHARRRGGLPEQATC